MATIWEMASRDSKKIKRDPIIGSKVMAFLSCYFDPTRQSLLLGLHLFHWFINAFVKPST